MWAKSKDFGVLSTGKILDAIKWGVWKALRWESKESSTDSFANLYSNVATCVGKVAGSSDTQAFCFEHLILNMSGA